MQRSNNERHASTDKKTSELTDRTRPAVVVKRARDEASIDDGMRVLVDRLWPRGLAKERVAADLWLPEVAPSNALRRWYANEPSRWLVFSQKYRSELEQRPDLLRLLDDLRREGRLTLIHGASHAERNHAFVLRQVLSERRSVATPIQRS